MIKIKVEMENTKIIAEYISLPSGNCMWYGECIDLPTGKNKQFWWSAEQMAAVLALGLHGVGEDKMSGYDPTKLYEIATPLFRDWPDEIQPIP